MDPQRRFGPRRRLGRIILESKLCGGQTGDAVVGEEVVAAELIDAGDKVLVLIRFGGRGKLSGAEALPSDSRCRRR